VELINVSQRKKISKNISLLFTNEVFRLTSSAAYDWSIVYVMFLKFKPCFCVTCFDGSFFV